jgi:predicted GNAT family acetyltransferase
MALTVTDAPDQQRYEARLDGDLAGYLEYRKADGVWSLTHAFTFPHQRGQGIAAEVTRYALDEARKAGASVRPVCPFVADYMAAHAEYAALRADGAGRH